jgi:hypothetical protein
MRTSRLYVVLAAGLLAGIFAARILAADSNEVTLTGMMVCGKCKLHETKECMNVLQVEKDGKTVNYYLTQNKVSRDFHVNICEIDGENVTVTGTVQWHDRKEVMTATKIVAPM